MDIAGLEPEPQAPQLEAKDAELLRYLEYKRQAPASREEIARSVWPEIPSSALANQQMDKAVERLRLHLGDDPHSPTRLITVGEFGFLLL